MVGISFSVRFREFCKKNLLEIAIVTVAMFVFAFFVISFTTKLAQLPSPIFGGDYYHSMGYVEHFRAGGSAFVNAALPGGLPSYFPTYTILAGGIAWLFSVSSFAAMKAFAIIEVFFAFIVTYLLGRVVFKDKFIALIFTFTYLDLTLFPVFKYLQFSMTFWLPLFFLAAYCFYEKPSVKSAVFLGISYGLLGISHSVAFVFGTVFMFVFGLYVVFFQYLQRTKFKFSFDSEFKAQFKSWFKFFVIIAVIGGAIALLYWYKPVFVYHAKPLNPVQDFDQPDLRGFSMQARFFWDSIQLVNFKTTLFAGAKSIFFLAGLAGIFIVKKYGNSHRFIVMMIIATLISSYHYFITQPLLGTSISPSYMNMLSILFTMALLVSLGAEMIAYFAKKYGKYATAAIALILLIGNVLAFSSYSANDKWVQMGMTPLAANLQATKDWVIKNTDVDDVFLSNNELSFALNSLTGRKLVTLKRGHTEMFSDAGKNMRDAAIILYGNDSAERVRLLKERNVKYFYWDINWINLEYVFTQNGQLQSIFDPFVLLDTPENRQMLTHYNMTYFAQNTWLDPAIRNEQIRKYDVLFLGPYRFDYFKMWNPDLDNYMDEVWNFKSGDQVVTRIFRINLNKNINKTAAG